MALDLIERAHAAGDFLNGLAMDPRVDTLRNELRFRAVLAPPACPCLAADPCGVAKAD